MPLFHRERTAKNVENIPITVLDLCYSTSKETLMILRSDFCVECCQFVSKTKLSLESLTNRMVVPLKLSFMKIAMRERTKVSDERLFAIGPMNTIYSWEFHEGVITI